MNPAQPSPAQPLDRSVDGPLDGPLPVQLLVLAKEPLPGRVKTRLCPPLAPEQAAAVAAAALQDTLAAVAATPVARRVLVLDGGAPRPAGFDVVPQRPGDLDARLTGAFAAAFADGAGLPALLVGMDTPQVTPALLESAARLLLAHGSVLGLAADGGWWALGLTTPQPAAFLGVPMSTDRTGAAQEARLRALGLDPAPLPVLRDIDTVADLDEVAAALPTSSALARLRAVAA